MNGYFVHLLFMLKIFNSSACGFFSVLSSNIKQSARYIKLSLSVNNHLCEHFSYPTPSVPKVFG